MLFYFYFLKQFPVVIVCEKSTSLDQTWIRRSLHWDYEASNNISLTQPSFLPSSFLSESFVCPPSLLRISPLLSLYFWFSLHDAIEVVSLIFKAYLSFAASLGRWNDFLLPRTDTWGAPSSHFEDSLPFGKLGGPFLMMKTLFCRDFSYKINTSCFSMVHLSFPLSPSPS